MVENLFLFTACEQCDFETTEIHLNRVSSSEIILIRDENKASLIHYACRYGYLNILKYFIEEKHIDIREIRTDHDAAVCDQMEIIKYLFHYNKQNRDEHENIPLHLVARYNSSNVVNYLLEEELADPIINVIMVFNQFIMYVKIIIMNTIQILLLKCPETINEQTNGLLTPIH